MTKTEILLVARARHLSSSGEGLELRLRAGLSLSELAGAVGVGVSTLWRWERGERSPRGAPAAAWVRLLDELGEAVPA